MSFLPDWLIIANDESLTEDQLRHLTQNKAVMALDGAVTRVLAAGIQPQLVLGDFDSIDPAIERKNNHTTTFVHVTDQETSDLEKGLLYLQKMNPLSVTIVNASGGRLDHTLYNLGLLKRFHGKFNALTLRTTHEQVLYCENQQVLLQAASPQPLALLAFTEAEVWSSGLKYEMQPLKLVLGHQESISNMLLPPTAHLKITGCLLLLASHDTQVSVE